MGVGRLSHWIALRRRNVGSRGKHPELFTVTRWTPSGLCEPGGSDLDWGRPTPHQLLLRHRAKGEVGGWAALLH